MGSQENVAHTSIEDLTRTVRRRRRRRREKEVSSGIITPLTDAMTDDNASAVPAAIELPSESIISPQSDS
jgi:hypothetical protein